MINLKKDRLAFVSQHYIEAQQFETHIGCIVFRLAGSVCVCYDGQPRYHGLHNHVLNFVLQVAAIRLILLQVLEKPGERSLVPFGHVRRTAIEHELGVVFVDRVVCEMHADILHVLLGWRFVSLGRKSGQALVINVEPQRVDTRH